MKLSRKKVKSTILIATAILLVAALSAVMLYFVLLPRKFRLYVRMYAAEYSLEEEFVYAVIRAESNFNVSAVSEAGAVGLMQIMPATADFVSAMEANEGYDLFDAEQNIACGCAYIFYLKKRFSDTDALLAAYNAGEGRVQNWLAKSDYSGDGETLDFIPFAETRHYVNKVKKFYKCYKILYF